MKVTSADDVILAVTAALDAAVTYPVFDGPPSGRPVRGTDRYVVIGTDTLDTGEDAGPANAADMSQAWKGLGQKARDEDLHIHCISVGKGSSVAAARGFAMAALQNTFDYLGQHPTNETYNALVSDISDVRVRNTSGGAVVHILFTISASARLT
ncbi:MAG TPA: hypothetical protein VEM32_06605 [Geobacteraceae bacterium]|nr:hypothetical protein [Geobacteraceae bacterium]